MYNIISFVIVVLLSPLWVPLGIYIALTYHWEDTVPSQDVLENPTRKRKEKLNS